jgi:hypothetical protein
MKAKNEIINQTKRVYSKPAIASIKIDNQISMVMMSTGTPPVEGFNNQHTNTMDPYKVLRG